MNTPDADPRQVSASRWVNRLDPLYILLDRLLFVRLFQPKKPGSSGEWEQLDLVDIEFLVDNVLKHRRIAWLNIVMIVYLWLHGAEVLRSVDEPFVVVATLGVLALVAGIGWYTMSFEGMPEKFVSTALSLTFWMFLAFTLSLTVLTTFVGVVAPWPLAVLVVFPIYFAFYFASVLHDNIDGLRVGFDPLRLNSRALAGYRSKHGVETPPAGPQISPEPEGTVRAAEVSQLSHYVRMLERNLSLLEQDRHERVANRIIASTTQLLFRVLSLPHRGLSDRAQQLESDKQYTEFVSNAHTMSVEKVDELTIYYLRLVLEEMRTLFGDLPRADLETAATTLDQFEDLRRLSTRTNDANSTVSEEATVHSEIREEGGYEQEMGDHLFAQVFHHLISLIKSHPQLFMDRKVEEN